MQIASWLLLQRAANSGEMTRDQVAVKSPRSVSTRRPRMGKPMVAGTARSLPALVDRR